MSKLDPPSSLALKKPKHQGMRTCIVCRHSSPRGEMMRFVADPNGQVWLDPYLKAPGRGAHLCYQLECLEKAYQKKSFSRAFKKKVHLISFEEMRTRILNAQEDKVKNLLTLGRKRRKTISGLNLLQNGSQTLYLVIASHDVSFNSLMKIKSNHNCPILMYQDRFHLGNSQGKAERVAIGINDVHIARNLIQEIHRYNQFLIASENHLKINTSCDLNKDV